MKRGLFNIVLLFAAVTLIFGSCTKEPDDITENKKISFLIYIASNNSLYSYGLENISELLSSYNAEDYKDGNIAVYYRGSDDDIPTLNIIDNNNALTPIKYYDIHSAADVEVMREVIADFKSYFVSEEYGCLFWSHGSAWLPQSFTGKVSSIVYSMVYGGENVVLSTEEEQEEDINAHPLNNMIRQIDYTGQTRAFCQDGSDWMEVYDLAEAIEDNSFDYMIFDACYMSSIEVAYALRNKADWFLSSPTEVLGAGMEYTTMAKNLLQDGVPVKDKLTAVAEDFCDKYSEVTVSLVDLTKIDDFATKYAALVAEIPDMLSGLTTYTVQRYDRYTNHVLFDICDYIIKLSPEHSDEIWELVDEIVEYRYSTDEFLYIDINTYSGLSTYIPFTTYSNLNIFYDQLDWTIDVLNR